MKTSPGGDVAVDSEQACVVYEAKTGRVVHLHRVITLRGGKGPSKDAMEARALELAGGGSRAEVKVLHLDPESLQSGSAYKVDLKKLQLVQSPPSAALSLGTPRKARK
jgi:hypothetical protein